MRLRKLFHTVLPLFLLLMAGCEKPVDVSNVVKCKAKVVRFFYPNDWDVTEFEHESGSHVIRVESPWLSRVDIFVYPVECSIDLRHFMASFVEMENENLLFYL